MDEDQRQANIARSFAADSVRQGVIHRGFYPSLPVGATDTHESTYASPAYRQGRDALRTSREVRPGLTEE